MLTNFLKKLLFIDNSVLEHFSQETPTHLQKSSFSQENKEGKLNEHV